jgi:hypothetical protein
VVVVFGNLPLRFYIGRGMNSGLRGNTQDGVLEIHVPNPEQVKPKKIAIDFDSGAKTIEGTATQSP